MKANELRINNWYKSVKFGVPVQCDLSDLMELYHNRDGAYDDPPIDEMFEPIPLTAEWLERLGMKITDDDYSAGIDEYRYTGVLWDDMILQSEGSFYLFVDIDDKWYSFKWTELKYVHQLQNLYFALTGNEPELIRQPI